MIEHVKSLVQPLGGDDSASALLARLERPAILLLDEDASIRLWNRGAEILYGWSAEEARGQPISWLAAEGSVDSALARAELSAVRVGGGGERVERRRRADGAFVTVTVRKVANPAESYVWDISEYREDLKAEPVVSLAGIGALMGAESLLFDASGGLRECSPADIRSRWSDAQIERARALALRALRTGEACEEGGSGTTPWLRACPLSLEGYASAVVLTRVMSSAEGNGRAELQRLADLCGNLFEAQEAERRRVARDLHDDLGQSLTGLLYTLESEDAPRERLWGEVSGLLAKVRGLSQGLRPGILDDLGLGAALRWLADEQSRHGDTEIVLELTGVGKRWPAELETALFRITQEALTNAARHASATRLAITVDDQLRELHMRIEDDGIGFELSGVGLRSTGLASMRERALLLGGRFDLRSEPGVGTRLDVWLPLLGEAGP